MSFKDNPDAYKEPRKPRPISLKVTYKHTNKEIVANARAEQLNAVIEAQLLKIQDPTLDAATLVVLTQAFVDLQHQYERLQKNFFTGDARGYKKNRGKKKKDGSVNHLLK